MNTYILPSVLMPSTPKGEEHASTGHRQLCSKWKQEGGYDHALGFVLSSESQAASSGTCLLNFLMKTILSSIITDLSMCKLHICGTSIGTSVRGRLQALPSHSLHEGTLAN